jgi:hypothetical protein
MIRLEIICRLIVFLASHNIYKRAEARIILRTLTYFRPWEEPAMNRFATLAVAAATLLSAAAPAFAGDAPRTSGAAPMGRINVALCERDALTQAAFRSSYGARPVFVTVEQVMSAEASGERWSSPRCMTSAEHRRLTQTLAQRQTRTAGARPIL